MSNRELKAYSFYLVAAVVYDHRCKKPAVYPESTLRAVCKLAYAETHRHYITSAPSYGRDCDDQMQNRLERPFDCSA
jgi:hypothetical protein